MPSEGYENVLIVQGNDFTIKTRKYDNNLAVFRCCDLSANCIYTQTTFIIKYFFPAVALNGFLSFIYHLSAMRT